MMEVDGGVRLALDPSSGRAAALLRRYRAVRAFTEERASLLAAEDQVVQSMPDVSPTKWHRAHTSWFFETFVLEPFLDDYTPIDPGYAYLFNSYYHGAGERHCRDQRGYISRPTVREVGLYRAHVDRGIEALFERLAATPGPEARVREALDRIELGLHHEQQHQELLITDIKHVFSVNPLRPSYHARGAPSRGWSIRGESGVLDVPSSPEPVSPRWIEFEGGLVEVGHPGGAFHFDNEGPRHRVHLEPFALADRLVTCGEYRAFIEDGGYRRPELWMSEGWAAVSRLGWTEPFYWEREGGDFRLFTLDGMRAIDPVEPVAHLSWFEADAFARWAGARLPTEFEWESAASGRPVEGNLAESGALHPRPASDGEGLRQLFGDLWEWTRSSYGPYPGFRPWEGAVGEYNGKFMCNQFVLRGGSCATPASHLRVTYRNFFPPESTWQFTGVRLARDLR